MNSRLLLKNTEALWHSLLEKNCRHAESQGDMLISAQYQYMETNNSLLILKSWVIDHHFDDWSSEVQFFKYWKPRFAGKFLFLSKCIEFCASLPIHNHQMRKEQIAEQLASCKNFYTKHRDFVSYFRKKSSHLDRLYFLRYKYDLNMEIPEQFHSYDERFSTSYDFLVAEILAYDEYELFLKNCLLSMKRKLAEVPKTKTKTKTEMTWTGSKCGLIELLLSIHQTKCINNGNVDFAVVVRNFESVFNIDLGNYYKTIGELRYRKTNRTKFLELLKNQLLIYMDKCDMLV